MVNKRWLGLLLLVIAFPSYAVQISIHNKTGTTIIHAVLMACAVGQQIHCSKLIEYFEPIADNETVTKNVEYDDKTCLCAPGISVQISLKNKKTNFCDIFPAELNVLTVNLYVSLNHDGFPSCLLK